ncbi:hypothetical protein IE53DRAFT_207522 [Violaceomyces palustris]|uniref:Uncharacterized protein n=1 Tax=Violaceomyces palustris TaxID=1673888 RepID=A0ACD0NQZ7_9BASI|nr:hypothetical protein IE53DRAFT_207522 [Violaceomyces palustris]
MSVNQVVAGRLGRSVAWLGVHSRSSRNHLPKPSKAHQQSPFSTLEACLVDEAYTASFHVLLPTDLHAQPIQSIHPTTSFSSPGWPQLPSGDNPSKCLSLLAFSALQLLPTLSCPPSDLYPFHQPKPLQPPLVESKRSQPGPGIEDCGSLSPHLLPLPSSDFDESTAQLHERFIFHLVSFRPSVRPRCMSQKHREGLGRITKTTIGHPHSDQSGSSSPLSIERFEQQLSRPVPKIGKLFFASFPWKRKKKQPSSDILPRQQPVSPPPPPPPPPPPSPFRPSYRVNTIL